MTMKQSVVCAASVLLIVLSASAGYSQTTGGVAAKVSTLGYGFDGAVSVTEKSNVRVGFNFLNFNHDFDNDGITLAAHLKLRSVTAAFDWFPFAGGFHVSPGIMIYNGNRVEAEALVPAGRTFDLGNDKLLSNPSNPVSGSAKVAYEKVAPAITFGWGNIATRGDRRWTIPVELGLVFSRAPTATLSLGGSACLQNGSNCRNIATEPLLQADVRQEEADLNDDLSVFKLIPVISVGFGYRF
jgi:hypothetical protein